ncbi:MAG: hypothetical protein ACE5GW_13905, partial [Planctomycetota bacterium]
EKLAPPAPRRWPWVAAALAILAAASPFLLRAWSRWRRLARRRSAYEVARTRLDRLLARPLPGAEDVAPFFVELSGIVRRYLENRFELRAPELTTEEFLEAASASPDLSAEHQPPLRDFLRVSDLVKFAHHVPDAEAIEGAIVTARRFLEETRENAPLLDDTEGFAAESPAQRAQVASDV